MLKNQLNIIHVVYIIFGQTHPIHGRGDISFKRIGPNQGGTAGAGEAHFGKAVRIKTVRV